MSNYTELGRDFAGLKQGEQLIYHTGFIVRDRTTKALRGQGLIMATEVNEIANYFLALSEKRLAHLVQTKVKGENSFNHSHYIAIKV